MSQLTDRLERDLREIAAQAHPSPSAWDSIVARLHDEGASQRPAAVALVRPFDPRRPTRQVWLAVAAAVLVVAIGTVAVLVARKSDTSISTVDPDETTNTSEVPSTATDAVSTIAPTFAPFVGAWVSTDTDGSSQRMEIVRSTEASYQVVLRDDAASEACAGAAATMTGTGLLETDARLVVAQPALTCDDGTVPSIGPPPQEQLADFTLEVVTDPDELVDTFGVVWRREGVTPSDAASAPDTVPVSPSTTSATSARETEPSPVTLAPVEPGTSGGMWPQSTLEDARAAQELADAGDPAATWQLDAQLAALEEPWGAAILTRFVEEGLGWDEFTGGFAGSGYVYGEAGGDYGGVFFIRCAAGRTNPLSPLYEDAPPEIRGCAPTIDDLTYETVSVNVSQPVRRGASGIWVVDSWEMRQSTYESRSLFGLLYPEFEQVVQDVPPSEADVTALLEAFLAARVEGAGAEQYVLREPEGSFMTDREVPLLYATTDGARFERFEVERLQGPVWPTGWSEYEVRLFADDETVVEQSFHVVSNDGQLGLVYGFPEDEIPTTENGQSVPEPYSVLDGEVTFSAAPPWRTHWGDDPSVMTLAAGRNENVVIAADPLPGGAGCESGPAAADADSLARSITTDPDFVTIGTAPVRVAGIDGLQVDVEVASAGPSVCWWAQWVLEIQPTVDAGYEGWRMRLYLIDHPGESAQVLAIAVIAPEDEFEDVLDLAMPIVESLEIHTG